MPYSASAQGWARGGHQLDRSSGHSSDTAAPSYNYSPRVNQPSSSFDWGAAIGQGISDGLRGRAQAEAAGAYDNNRNRNYNDDNQYYSRPRNNYNDDNNYRAQPRYQQPYIAPAKPVVPAKPKPNPKPPEKINAARDNAAAELPFEAIDGTTLSLGQQIVQKEAEEELNGLADSLGDAAKDPAVQAILEEGRQSVADGKPLPTDWEDRLQAAATTAGLPPTFDPAKVRDQLDSFEGLAEANAQLSADPNGAGALTEGGGFPTGPSSFVTMPSLPEGEMCMCPNGCVLVGTGGEGAIDVVEADAAEILGIPLGVGEPEPDATGDVAKRIKSGVLLMNDKKNSETINYVIANANYAMQPGYTQRLTEGQTWIVAFDRGDGHGEAKYTLSDGTYVFGASDKGWELYRSSFGVTIDNERGDAPFNYNVDNTQEEVAAGQSKSHTSLYPLLVRFDRGDGGDEAQKKVVAKGRRLEVAVNPQDGFWDLYPANAKSRVAKAATQTGATRLAGSAVSAEVKKSDRMARLKAALAAAK